MDTVQIRSQRREEKVQERLHAVKMINASYLVALLVLGFIMVTIASWMIGVRFWQCPILNILYLCAWLFLSLGILSVIVSIVGGFIIYKGKTNGTLLPFMIGTGVLVVGLLVVLILSAKFGEDLGEPEYTNSLFSLFVEAKTEHATRDFAHRPLLCWDSLQRTLRCCGGYSPNDWLRSVNATGVEEADNATQSAKAWQLDPPRSCECSHGEPNASCVSMPTADGQMRRLYRQGCIASILDIAETHLLVLKVATPILAVFIIIHVSLAFWFTVRASRMSTVDVYASENGSSVAGGRRCEVPDEGRRRGNRFADVDGIAPLAFRLETTAGCT